jgi:hypothetical protein
VNGTCRKRRREAHLEEPSVDRLGEVLVLLASPELGSLGGLDRGSRSLRRLWDRLGAVRGGYPGRAGGADDTEGVDGGHGEVG